MFGLSRWPIGNFENSTALRASSTESTIGMMMPSAPASVAFWMSPSFAVGTRTNGMLPASATTLMSCCVSRQVSVLCCISIQMKSTPSQAFLAASRSGPMMVLLKICFPSFSLVMTVLNVCEPALTAVRPGAGCDAAATCGAGFAAPGGTAPSRVAARTSAAAGTRCRVRSVSAWASVGVMRVCTSKDWA